MVARSSHVRKFPSDCGITLLLSTPYAPEQNGVTECEHRTVVELIWSMLSVSRLQYRSWHRLVKMLYMCSIIEKKHQLSGNLQRKCGMVTWWRTWIIYVCLALSVMYTSQRRFRRNLKTRACLVEWLAISMIKMGTRFTCHLSTRLCTCMLSTSSQNEFASVQRLKWGWKMQLWKMWLWRKGMKMTHCQIRHSWSKPSRWRPRNSFPRTQDK